MGCGSSVDVVSRIKEQDKKIDNLIEINKNLQKRLNEMGPGNNSDPKISSDTNDLTNLKTTIDLRFNKLEKTVGKIHSEFKVKLFEGIVDNLDDDGVENNNRRESLTLNFDKEHINKGTPKPTKTDDPHWNDLLNDTNMTPLKVIVEKIPNFEEHISPRIVNRVPSKNVVDHNDIQMDFGTPIGNVQKR